MKTIACYVVLNVPEYEAVTKLSHPVGAKKFILTGVWA